MKQHRSLMVGLLVLILIGAGSYIYLTSLDIPAPSRPVEKELDHELYIE